LIFSTAVIHLLPFMYEDFYDDFGISRSGRKKKHGRYSNGLESYILSIYLKMGNMDRIFVAPSSGS
jgi:hypothetical protein